MQREDQGHIRAPAHSRISPNAFCRRLGTDEGKEFVKSWSVYFDPAAIFTTGREI